MTRKNVWSICRRLVGGNLRKNRKSSFRVASIKTGRDITQLAILLPALFLVSCAAPEAIQVARYDAIQRPPTAAIQVFQVGEHPRRPIHVIASLSIAAHARDEGLCLQRMIDRSRQLGAEVLLLDETDQPNRWKFDYTALGPQPDDRVFRARAALWEPQAPATSATPPGATR